MSKPTDEELEAQFKDTLAMLRKTFPEWPGEEQYGALIWIFYDSGTFSFRGIAALMEYFYEVDWGKAYNDILGYAGPKKPPDEVIANVRETLSANRFEDWLESDT